MRIACKISGKPEDMKLHYNVFLTSCSRNAHFVSQKQLEKNSTSDYLFRYNDFYHWQHHDNMENFLKTPMSKPTPNQLNRNPWERD